MSLNTKIASGLNKSPYPDVDLDQLLANTTAFIKKMHFLREPFELIPKNQHIGTCINYSDLLPMKDEFVKEMMASILRFVYSADQQVKIKKDFMSERDEDNAYMMLVERAKDKFRKSDIKGQFSELLIFNLLQHHFKAVPLLRKMRITTNPNLERNGADAIHIAKENGKYILYLAECKTYDREKNAFKDALRDAINDVITHYRGHRHELNLYTFEEFIPAELEKLARDYLDGTITDIEVRLVCMVTYRSEEQGGDSREEILDNIMESIRTRARLLSPTFFDNIPRALHPRLCYILFPIHEMEKVLRGFGGKLGGTGVKSS